MTVHNFNDLTGKRFGRLLVAERSENRNGKVSWKCFCDCSNIKIVTSNMLVSRHTRSCGCLHREELSKRTKTHGHTANNTTTPEFRSWFSMIRRCTKENDHAYPRYGGRGIKICDRWLSFSEFLKDMGERPSKDHSLDRIDVNGNYEPSNCRWATNVEQARNKRCFNSLGKPGIYLSPNKKYLAKITHTTNGIKSTVHLGTFNDLESAIQARKEAELKYWRV